MESAGVPRKRTLSLGTLSNCGRYANTSCFPNVGACYKKTPKRTVVCNHPEDLKSHFSAAGDHNMTCWAEALNLSLFEFDCGT